MQKLIDKKSNICKNPLIKYPNLVEKSFQIQYQSTFFFELFSYVKIVYH